MFFLNHQKNLLLEKSVCWKSRTKSSVILPNIQSRVIVRISPNIDETGHHFGLQINTAKNIRSNVPCLVEILIHFCNNNPFGFFLTLMFINKKKKQQYFFFNFLHMNSGKKAFIILVHRLHIIVTFVLK